MFLHCRIFNRITKLTPEEFHADIIGELTPDPSARYPAGLDAICRDGDIGVIDGKTYVIDATALLRKLAARLLRKRPEIFVKIH